MKSRSIRMLLIISLPFVIIQYFNGTNSVNNQHCEGNRTTAYFGNLAW